jgi:RNA ligase
MQNIQELIKKYDIPVVDSTTGALSQQFIDFTRQLEGKEGFVIRFNDGHMVKLKADIYCQLHRVKSDVNHERGVVSLLLEGKMDDIKSMLPANDLERIENYESAFAHMMQEQSIRIGNILHGIEVSVMTRKDYALNIMPKEEKWVSNIVFKLWDEDAFTVDIGARIKDFILSNCTRNSKFESLRQDTTILNNVPEWRPVMFSDGEE